MLKDLYFYKMLNFFSPHVSFGRLASNPGGMCIQLFSLMWYAGAQMPLTLKYECGQYYFHVLVVLAALIEKCYTIFKVLVSIRYELLIP
jgi:hypothetical protein